MQKDEAGPLLDHIQKNSKCIKNLNIRPEIIKFQEKSTGSKLSNNCPSNIFLDPYAQVITTTKK